MPCMLLQRNTGDLVRGLIMVDSFDSVDKSGCIDYKSLQDIYIYRYRYYHTYLIFLRKLDMTALAPDDSAIATS